LGDLGDARLIFLTLEEETVAMYAKAKEWVGHYGGQGVDSLAGEGGACVP